MPDQLVLGVRVHMVLVAEEAAAMLLGPARIAVLLPHFGGLLLPPRRCAPSLQLGVLVTTVPLRRHQHDTGVDDLPATRQFKNKARRERLLRAALVVTCWRQLRT